MVGHQLQRSVGVTVRLAQFPAQQGVGNFSWEIWRSQNRFLIYLMLQDGANVDLIKMRLPFVQ